MNAAIIYTKNVYKIFEYQDKTVSVLQNLSVSFEQGCTYAITGVSGIGKSTLIHMLAGLDAPTAGAIYINNNDLATLSPQEHAQFLIKSVGLLFQKSYLIRELSVEENVMVPGIIAGIARDICKKRAHDLLEQVGIIEKATDLVGALSGGQQQRVALARALFHKPSFLLADEPTGNLDEQTGYEIVRLLTAYQQEWGMGIIVSTHDLYVAQSMEIRYQLRDGQLHKL